MHLFQEVNSTELSGTSFWVNMHRIATLVTFLNKYFDQKCYAHILTFWPVAFLPLRRRGKCPGHCAGGVGGRWQWSKHCWACPPSLAPVRFQNGAWHSMGAWRRGARGGEPAEEAALFILFPGASHWLALQLLLTPSENRFLTVSRPLGGCGRMTS